MPSRRDEEAGIVEQIAGQVASNSSGPVRIIAIIVVVVLGVVFGGSYLGTSGFGSSSSTNNTTGNFNGTNNTGSVNTGSSNNTNSGVSSGSGSSSSSTGSGETASNLHFGVQLKQSGCRVRGAYEDSDCTPGAVFPNVTTSQICVSGYSSSVRNVPTSEKDQVYASYGIASHTTGEYEVDHLVSLELGGSNDIANLWPEAANPTPGFHQKDLVENYLHDQVCSGRMSLHDAQVQIATDWMVVWHQMGN